MSDFREQEETGVAVLCEDVSRVDGCQELELYSKHFKKSSVWTKRYDLMSSSLLHA
jgi:hypothetical protein